MDRTQRLEEIRGRFKKNFAEIDSILKVMQGTTTSIQTDLQDINDTLVKLIKTKTKRKS